MIVLPPMAHPIKAAGDNERHLAGCRLVELVDLTWPNVLHAAVQLVSLRVTHDEMRPRACRSRFRLGISKSLPTTRQLRELLDSQAGCPPCQSVFTSIKRKIISAALDVC
jgi:hypothetical protein